MNVPRQVMALAGVALAAALLLNGCAARVVAPRQVEHPQWVYVLVEGGSSSLALPAEDGDGLVRYLYADWNYYALDHHGPIGVLGALFWPTTGALGRQFLSGVDRPDRLAYDDIHEVQVERQRVVALRQELGQLHVAQEQTSHYHAAYDMTLVHHPQTYWLMHNSNHALASWLRALGCDVRGAVLLSTWRVK